MFRAAAGDHKKPEFEWMNHSISCGSIEQEHHRREAWRQVCREVLQSLGRRRLPTSIHSRLACYRCEIANEWTLEGDVFRGLDRKSTRLNSSHQIISYYL